MMPLLCIGFGSVGFACTLLRWRFERLNKYKDMYTQRDIYGYKYICIYINLYGYIICRYINVSVYTRHINTQFYIVCRSPKRLNVLVFIVQNICQTIRTYYFLCVLVAPRCKNLYKFSQLNARLYLQWIYFR